jgi:hypothetical protein
MGILLGEKLIQAAIAAGLETVKAQSAVIVPFIFDADIYGAAYLNSIKTYLAANKIRVSQGFPLDQAQFPGLFISPASIQAREVIVGEMALDDDTEEDTTDEWRTVFNANTIRVLTASDNMDVTIFLDAIGRYILHSGHELLAANYGIAEFTLGVNDIDPIIQYLPQSYFYRTTIVSFVSQDSWPVTYPVIKTVESYLSFTEDIVI